MVTMPQSPPQPRAPSASTSRLDPRKLALASLSSVIGGVLGAAFGGSVVMTFVGMAVGPWITAFVEHPGPHRHRRVALVALFAVLVHLCQRAVASVRSRYTSTARAPHSARQLGSVALTATTSVAVAILLVTGGELAAGHALAGDRDTTFFGGGSGRQGPSLRVPGHVVATTPDPDGRRVTYRVTASDDKGNLLTPTCIPASGSAFAIGVTRVRCTVTDANANRAEDGFDVTVRRGRASGGADTKAPTLAVPADFTRETPTGEALTVTYLVTAGDDHDGPLSPTCRPASGTRFALGTTPVKCSVTDAAGRTTRDVFAVTVVRAGQSADTTPPQLGVPDDIRRAATGPAGRSIPYAATAHDDRDGAIEPSCDPLPGSAFAITTSQVRCTATNRAGLSTSLSFTIEVFDGPPVLDIEPTVVVAATSDKGAKVRFVAKADDAVEGALAPECEPASGNFFTLGEHTVRCTVTDRAGGTDAGTIAVTVTEQPDTTRPTISGKRMVSADSFDGGPVAVRLPLVARDARDGVVAVVCVPASGSEFAPGPTRVTCTARDRAGNEATRLVRVVVFDRSVG